MVTDSRRYWIDTMSRIAEPVLNALSEKRLKASMPVKGDPSRIPYMHLEALGRLLAGMAPWLETGGRSGEEGELRERYAELARRAIDAGTDPESPDCVNLTQGEQPLVDMAFLAQAILRAPTELWDKLDARVKKNVTNALYTLRRVRPFYSNWLLFAATVEACLFRIGEQWDPMRIDFALKQHEKWYLGDGMYSDGEEFAWDYYNGFVIQPMLIDILDTVGDQYQDWAASRPVVLQRAKRYAAIQERLISPEGTFPPIGRSLAYRFGAFQPLSQMALREDLPEKLAPPQVRCALTAVIKRMAEAPGFYDDRGWLSIGFCGDQPEIGELYISAGSVYLCSLVFLPLGLPAESPFWRDADQEWTSRKAWSGLSFPIDKSL
ncbi:DUF2264 domain-containing protein [Paenibacillus sp. VCA1]|uniref:DUF2264 domain-containing protein n=1 Tax=Paenibacillus sp. VCA1 TaxID=3039148 RepID=UPI0028710DD4|nr:DUF2264 domain-containing protein [Paenibacillus sp. VCA1]MDR9854210.1 DUF2264 domain-containing protein [Paenibacillus sp. VCA1]